MCRGATLCGVDTVAIYEARVDARGNGKVVDEAFGAVAVGTESQSTRSTPDFRSPIHTSMCSRCSGNSP